MHIGMMNDPARDPVAEARWAADHNFDFVDLTMEGPAAAVDQIDVAAIGAILRDSGMGVIGHTAWYLPFAAPVPELRAGAVAAVTATFESYATLGATIVSVHVDRGRPTFPHDDTIRWNGESFAALAELAAPFGITVAVENVVNNLNNARALSTILGYDSRLRFHLDVGHSNVKGDRTAEFVKQLGDRLVHLHIHDNNRTGDDHLPLGVGTIRWPEQLAIVRSRGYDSTITLEVHTADRSYLLDSRERLRKLWSNE